MLVDQAILKAEVNNQKEIMATNTNQFELISKYESGDFRLSLERLDFILPQITDLMKKDRFLNLRPEYQRRLVWDVRKKSLLIESLLMNVPIPPIFLFETDWNQYEVMDGQQRLNTIIDFFNDSFALKGLEKWKELNGLSFSDLPDQLKRGLERRKLPATVLMTESITVNSTREDVRQLVFERLNTGGQQLNAQELRNCIYSGAFNQLLIELSSEDLFCDVWEIPRHRKDRHGALPEDLMENRYFKRMLDCEIVLRFFAFRVPQSQIKGSVRSMLDSCMELHRGWSADQCLALKNIYLERLSLAKQIFGASTFKLPKIQDGKLSEPLYDAVMVALDRLYDQKPKIIKNRAAIKQSVEKAINSEDNYYELIVNKANTATAIKNRILETEKLIRAVIGS